MSGSLMGPLQAAMYARLTGDATLMALLPGGVKDHVPANTPFPYIAIGEAVETPHRTMGKNGHEDVPTLRIWGSQLGYKNLQAILDRATTVLEGTPLTISGHSSVLLWYEDAQSVPDFADDDTELRQIIAHYRVVALDS